MALVEDGACQQPSILVIDSVQPYVNNKKKNVFLLFTYNARLSSLLILQKNLGRKDYYLNI